MSVQHCCGQSLTLVLRPSRCDVTGYDDVPPHLRDSRGLPTVSLAALPLQYHTYITVGQIVGWQVENVTVYTCPGCGATLLHGLANDREVLAEMLKESGIQL